VRLPAPAPRDRVEVARHITEHLSGPLLLRMV
jgi:hypothetical protein